jgi:hypothetical protein
MEVRAHGLAGMPFCNATDDGTAVVFTLLTDRGAKHSFAASQEAIEQIIIRFTGAAQRATERAPGKYMPVWLEALHHEIGVSDSRSQVTLKLGSNPKSLLRFSLSRQAAEQIREGLTEALKHLA